MSIEIANTNVHGTQHKISNLHSYRKWQRLIASVNSKESYQQPNKDQNTELQRLFFQLDTTSVRLGVNRNLH